MSTTRWGRRPSMVERGQKGKRAGSRKTLETGPSLDFAAHTISGFLGNSRLAENEYGVYHLDFICVRDGLGRVQVARHRNASQDLKGQDGVGQVGVAVAVQIAGQGQAGFIQGVGVSQDFLVIADAVVVRVRLFRIGAVQPFLAVGEGIAVRVRRGRLWISKTG